jgi:hypothetical protein
MDKLIKKYSAQLSQLEYELQILEPKIDLPKKQMRARAYFLSSHARRCFGVLVIRNTLHEELTTITDTAKLLGISRNSAETIANDCEAEGWVASDRSIPNYRYLSATPFLLEVWGSYAERVRDVSTRIDFSDTHIAIKALGI